jgi:hypothetical protein
MTGVMARLLGLLATMGLSLGCGGCSFLFADPAPPRHETLLYFDCTSTPGLEVADGVFGLSTALAGVTTLSQSETEYEDDNPDGDRNTAAAVNFVLAGVFAGSAIYGIVVTENCSDAKADLRQRIMERERQRTKPPSAPPAMLPPAPPPPAVAPPAAQPPSGATPAPPGAEQPPPAVAPPPAAPAAPPAVPPPTPAPTKPGSGSF